MPILHSSVSHGALALLAIGCGEPLYAGSDVVWVATHERGDLAEWSADARGGSFAGVAANPAGIVEVSREAARSGEFSAKLTRNAVAAETGPGLFRDVRG